MLLFFFVAYMLNTKMFNKYILVLVIFANFFILETYVFTLVADATLEKKIWPRATGLGPEDYDPGVSKEHWRYNPPLG